MMISEFGLMTASKQVSWPLWVMLATIMPMAALWLVNAVMRVRAVIKQQVAAATIKYADASSLPNTLQ
ncbi:hypothetical protein [Shewanella waksmanii]|uniref:hypothetical protein n=1 Tax=Shewanella waksmanii TaxID=213783 RepID=UPI00048E6BB2|nr:hypothetical protein [Shewanella waksmanii]